MCYLFVIEHYIEGEHEPAGAEGEGRGELEPTVAEAMVELRGLIRNLDERITRLRGGV